ncbi:MAG: alanine--glyoxylate aminotransferase family protein [Thermoleophilia bacterium]|nr:alanine--glyoxylate aminotransferase family protein [Thermoleophilia bacterium]
MKPADFTLSAGPTTCSSKTLAALGSPIVYHYDPMFIEQYKATEAKVKAVFRSSSDLLLMQGEAVLGLEAAGRAVVRPGMACLNLSSGVFGKGYGDWLRAWGATVHEIDVPYDDAVDPSDVERALEEHPEIEVVAVVHSETPSGTLNPVAEIGPLAKAHGAITIVDCVSSIGGMPFDPDAWQLDICIAGAQKCLSGPPGITMMTVSQDAWDLIARNPEAPRYSFLSLLDWKIQWLEGGKFPFTPSVADVHGLEACCEEVLAEGLDNSFARHSRAARACREGVKALGLRLWPRSEDIMSTCTTAIAVPDGLTDIQVRTHVRERYGVMISGGQGAGNLVRIGHMGVTANTMYPVVGVAALGRSLLDLGVSVDLGAGVEAALAVMSQA